MARRAELAVLPGGRDLAEHVFVDVALGVAIVHPHRVELLDGFSEQRRRRDPEPRILHVLAESRAFPAERAQERKDMLVDNLEHFARLEKLEPRPAQIFVGPVRVVLPFGKMRRSIGILSVAALLSSTVCNSSRRLMKSR